MSFLRAEWRKLAIANYAIDPDLLKDQVPFGTELDLWEGKCYVSLVAFMFLNTKVMGMKIPFHTNFEEANLRFYVRSKDGDNWKRGVVFIKEIVPRHAISFVANTFYNENYVTLPMRHSWKKHEDELEISYAWKQQDFWHSFAVKAEAQAQDLGVGSEAEFITEHYWGYAPVNAQKSNEYEVRHPRWEHYKVRSQEIIVDFGRLYGSRFAILNDRQPDSVMLAEGSEISVENKSVLTP